MTAGRPARPGLDDLLASLRVVSIPMRVRFRGVRHREAALLEGPKGWGEFAPFLEYEPPESARWLAAAIEAGWTGWPPPRRAAVPVNATVPAVPAAEVPAVVARFDGCTTAKIKVAESGQTLADDVARVAAVREVMGPDARIRVDANGGWSLDDARSAISALAPFALEYVEQPCAAVDDLARLRVALARDGLDVLVAADESIRKAEDPLEVARLEAADLVVVKVPPLGGVARALEVVADCGLPAVVSSALDASTGIRAGLALAAALPELPHACGLATATLLEGDVMADPLVPVGGAIPLRPAVPEPALLERWAAPPERAEWWRRRVADAYGHLPG